MDRKSLTLAPSLNIATQGTWFFFDVDNAPRGGESIGRQRDSRLDCTSRPETQSPTAPEPREKP